LIEIIEHFVVLLCDIDRVNERDAIALPSGSGGRFESGHMICFLLFPVQQKRKKKQSEKYYAILAFSCLLSIPARLKHDRLEPTPDYGCEHGQGIKTDG